MMGFSAQLFDPENEYRFKELRYKVSRYAMDSLRKSVAYGIPREMTSVVDDCLCACKVNFGIPCHHVLLQHDVIPLDIIPTRWHLKQTGIQGKFIFIMV